MMNDIHDMTGMVPLYQFIGVESERDRLAAENAELRAKLDPDALTICYMSGRATGDAEARAMAKRLRAANATLDQERAAYAVLLESHEIILDALTESDAALDALREAIGPLLATLLGEASRTENEMNSVRAAWDILNPQPAAPAEEKTNG